VTRNELKKVKNTTERIEDGLPIPRFRPWMKHPWGRHRGSTHLPWIRRSAEGQYSMSAGDRDWFEAKIWVLHHLNRDTLGREYPLNSPHVLDPAGLATHISSVTGGHIPHPPMVPAGNHSGVTLGAIGRDSPRTRWLLLGCVRVVLEILNSAQMWTELASCFSSGSRVHDCLIKVARDNMRHIRLGKRKRTQVVALACDV
jgi:hypothetical protein